MFDQGKETFVEIANGTQPCPRKAPVGLSFVSYRNVTFAFTTCENAGAAYLSNLNKTIEVDRGLCASYVSILYKKLGLAGFLPNFMSHLEKYKYGLKDLL